MFQPLDQRPRLFSNALPCICACKSAEYIFPRVPTILKSGSRLPADSVIIVFRNQPSDWAGAAARSCPRQAQGDDNDRYSQLAPRPLFWFPRRSRLVSCTFCRLCYPRKVEWSGEMPTVAGVPPGVFQNEPWPSGYTAFK